MLELKTTLRSQRSRTSWSTRWGWKGFPIRIQAEIADGKATYRSFASEAQSLHPSGGAARIAPEKPSSHRLTRISPRQRWREQVVADAAGAITGVVRKAHLGVRSRHGPRQT